MHRPQRREETREFLQLRRTGDPAVRERIVRRYLPLARQVARRFQRGSEALEDLEQVASYGLVKAVDGFDPNRGLAFTSYALPTITGELKRHARHTAWGMHVPRGLQERVLDVERATSTLTSELGRSPTAAEVAGLTGLGKEEVLEALEAASNHMLESLDVPLATEPDAATRLDTVGSDDGGYDFVDDVNTLAPALRELPERERKILSMRFGAELPQSEIARRLGISQMHVSRLLRRTLDDLRERVREPVLAGRL